MHCQVISKQATPSQAKSTWEVRAKCTESAFLAVFKGKPTSQVWLAVNKSSQVVGLSLAVNTSSQVWLAVKRATPGLSRSANTHIQVSIARLDSQWRRSARNGPRALHVHVHTYIHTCQSVVNGIGLLGMDREPLIEIILRAPAIALITTVALHAHHRPRAIRHVLRVIIEVAGEYLDHVVVDA